ncbi:MULTISPECIES: GNAT family N-acetyltransferase [unclassified Ruegeria]|uniref:GNAT family N-acetyltransferase n=1 Tax=unclassified Ruegeria TaxID=2625375 RepID=UPI001AD99D64|nr:MULTISPECIES: GNAT family N-acetyltransferase [unclassified Ruegeria]MBO9410501.1 GNAT family N-acetyltransferase [Ruegeria sp. R8_1]MBO9414280.1 GNAT family N-acetyltransferase [Ruegeria sp. R8_2]
MSAALKLARPEDLDRLMGLVAAFHAEAGIEQDSDHRRSALAPLLEGIPHGCVYLIGPARAPLGYAILTFGWSVEFGGMDAFIDEIYIRPAVRGRGIATEVLLDLPKALAGAGLTALHLEVDRTNETAQRLYLRTGFKPRDRYVLMSKKL